MPSDTTPQTGAPAVADEVLPAPVAARPPSGWRRWLVSTHHIDVGNRYLALSLLVTAALAAIISLALANSVSPAADVAWLYAGLVKSGFGQMILFFATVPALLGGFGNWLIPGMIGATGMAFPRLNAAAFWLLPIGGALAITGPPFALIGLHLAGLGALLLAGTLIVTILNMRAPSQTLHSAPPLIWGMLVSAMLLLLAAPVLAGSVMALLMAGQMGPDLLSPALVRMDAIPPHLMAEFLNHPSIFILLLPGFAIALHIIADATGRPCYRPLLMAYGTVGLGLAGFLVWTHHMLGLGNTVNLTVYYGLASAIIGASLALYFAAWVHGLWGHPLKLDTPLLFVLGMITLFALGIVSGIVATSDWEASDLVLPHAHYTMAMGTLLVIFAGLYRWLPDIIGCAPRKALGRLQFITIFLGICLMFLPQHLPLFDPTSLAQLAQAGLWLSIASLVIFAVTLAEALKRSTQPEK